MHGQPYFFGRVGVFEPNTDTDGLKFFDSGMNFELGIGSRVSPILAVEGALGSYNTGRRLRSPAVPKRRWGATFRRASTPGSTPGWR
jgi:hypothetical protein